jgi:pimeloyl-ACP methyl ester carboxylesterase
MRVCCRSGHSPRRTSKRLSRFALGPMGDLRDGHSRCPLRTRRARRSRLSGGGGRSAHLLFSPPLSDLYSIWAAPFTRPFLDRLAAALRLVVFNPRGTGFSDKPRDISLEARMDDIAAVLESLDVDRVSLLGNWIGANTCLFAASYPERCERLVLQHVAPRGTASHDYPYGASEEWALEWIREVRAHYGEREFLEQWARSVDPSVTETPDALDWFVWQRRMAASPSAAAEWTRVHMETDITDVLSAIRAPTLLMHRDADREIAAFVAQRFKDARTLEVRSVFSEEASTDHPRVHPGRNAARCARFRLGNGSLHGSCGFDGACSRRRGPTLARDARSAPPCRPA